MTWYILFISLFLLVLGLFAVAFVGNKKQRQQQQQVMDELAGGQFQLQQNLNLLRKQFQELQSSSQQKHKLLAPMQVQIEQQQTQLESMQSALQLLQSESSENKFYSRAKKMIEMGADLEEVIQECEMPRGEAELLFSLYRS